MTLSFVCPDCSTVHERPLEATFTIAVRCQDCHLDAELSNAGAVAPMEPPTHRLAARAANLAAGV